MSYQEHVTIPSGPAGMEGMLDLPAAPRGVVLFAHGSGSSRLSPRNNYVASFLREAGFGTLLLDLLTADEDTLAENRFDIGLLTTRLADAVAWLRLHPAAAGLPLGLFGASTGAAAAVQLAAICPSVAAVVSRGGRPDLAGHSALARVRVPTLLIVGGDDQVVLRLNRKALAELQCEKELTVIPGATHLFEELGTLDEVARLATAWFTRHLPGP
jgi:dienelactone hydrolase